MTGDTRGYYVVDHAIARRWDESNLDTYFRAYWPLSKAFRFEPLSRDEARPETPFPFCVFQRGDPMIVGHSSGRLSEGHEEQYAELLVEFSIYTKPAGGRTAREIAEEAILRVKSVFDPGRALLDVEPPYRHIVTIAADDKIERVGDQEYLAYLSYRLLIDASHNRIKIKVSGSVPGGEVDVDVDIDVPITPPPPLEDDSSDSSSQSISDSSLSSKSSSSSISSSSSLSSSSISSSQSASSESSSSQSDSSLSSSSQSNSSSSHSSSSKSSSQSSVSSSSSSSSMSYSSQSESTSSSSSSSEASLSASSQSSSSMSSSSASSSSSSFSSQSSSSQSSSSSSHSSSSLSLSSSSSSRSSQSQSSASSSSSSSSVQTGSSSSSSSQSSSSSSIVTGSSSSSSSSSVETGSSSSSSSSSTSSTSSSSSEQAVLLHEPGDIAKATWDAFLATLPTNPTTGRPQPITYNAGIGVDSRVGRFLTATDFECPTMEPSGKFVAFSEPVQHDPHCIMMLSNPDPGKMNPLHAGYSEGGVLYDLQMTVDLVSPLAEWQAKPWVLIWQAHPGSFPPGWTNPSKNPPLALYIINGEWQFGHRGSTAVFPTDYTFQTLSSTIPITTGENDIRISWRQDYTGSNAYVSCLINGVSLYSSLLTNGLNHSALGAGNQASLICVGNYRTSGGTTWPDLKILDVSFWRD